jgi:hypothetical protein
MLHSGRFPGFELTGVNSLWSRASGELTSSRLLVEAERQGNQRIPVSPATVMSRRILNRLPGSSSYLIPELLEHVTKRIAGDGLQFRREGRLPPPERRRNITAGQVPRHLRILS